MPYTNPRFRGQKLWLGLEEENLKAAIWVRYWNIAIAAICVTADILGTARPCLPVEEAMHV
jgi:hypothetical protein